MEQELADHITLLFEQTYGKLHSVAFRLTGSRDTADELVQDAFVLAVIRGKKFMDHPNPAAWLMLTVTHLCSNHCKRHSLTDVSFEDLFQRAAPETDRGILELLPTKLPDEDKQILIWRFEAQMDYRMIADRLGITEAGCRTRVFRAVERCRTLLTEDELSK